MVHLMVLGNLPIYKRINYKHNVQNGQDDAVYHRQYGGALNKDDIPGYKDDINPADGKDGIRSDAPDCVSMESMVW